MINQQSGEPALEGLENLALRQIHHDGEVVEVDLGSLFGQIMARRGGWSSFGLPALFFLNLLFAKLRITANVLERI